MSFLKQLEGEWAVISGAPLSFILSVVLLCAVGWWLIHFLYKVQIGNLTSQLQLADRTNKSMEVSLKAATDQATKETNRPIQVELKEEKVSDDWKLSDWVDHDAYYLWAVACLWINVKPAPKINETHPAYPTLQKIKASIETGKAKTLYGGAGITDKIHRDELIKLAERYGEKPKFLFQTQGG